MDERNGAALRPIEGACLCGAVRIVIARGRTALGPMVWCHCAQCRKGAGAPFQAVVPVARTDCRIEDAGGNLRAFRATPGKARWFCGRCGSPLFSERDGAATLRLRAGVLDGLEGVAPVCHIHVADAAPWHRIADALPRYEGLEPGRQRPS